MEDLIQMVKVYKSLMSAELYLEAKDVHKTITAYVAAMKTAAENTVHVVQHRN